MIQINVDDRAFKRAVSAHQDHLRGTRTVNNVIGRSVRDYTKDTIRMGGRADRPWMPLSSWTIRKTGHTKPLQGLVRLIRYSANAAGSTVYAAPTGGDWDVDQHHTGYYVPARYAHGKVMVVKLGKEKAFFKSAEAFRVAARPFWPTRPQVQNIARDSVATWVDQGARTSWR